MHTFFAEGDLEGAESALLTEEESRHAGRVLRLRAGEEVVLGVVVLDEANIGCQLGELFPCRFDGIGGGKGGYGKLLDFFVGISFFAAISVGIEFSIL